jgi:hypothetical protein
MCCLGPSQGGLFASYISGEHGEWPAAFNAAVLTFLVALAYFGALLLLEVAFESGLSTV